MIFQIEEQLNLAIAEKIESEMKKMHPGKVERIKVIESNGKFALKIIGSISDSEVTQFMKNFFGKDHEMEEPKQEGLMDIVGGKLGKAIQQTIVSVAQKQVDDIVKDFKVKADEKLSGMDNVVNQKFLGFSTNSDTRISNVEKQAADALAQSDANAKAINGLLEKLKEAGQILEKAGKILVDMEKSPDKK